MNLVRWTGLSMLASICAFNGFSQSNSPPQFQTFSGPSEVYPDCEIIFKVSAASSEVDSLNYELLSGPSNVTAIVAFDRPPETYLWISWHTPPRSEAGTTHVFIVRASDSASPPSSSTNAISIKVIEPPRIGPISFSNNLPVLQLNDLLADKTYHLDWTDELTPADWKPLLQLERVDPDSRPPVILFTDSSPIATQRFYRLRPSSWECYAGAGCP